MDFFDVASTTPTTRRFLDRPIAETELIKILETANMAPSGSNAQPWEFVVVRDANARREIQQLYESVWGPYKDSAIIRGRTTLSPRAVKALKTGDEFSAQLAIVPVHVVVFLDRPKMRVERGSAADLFNFGATYGSDFPRDRTDDARRARSRCRHRDDHDAHQQRVRDQGAPRCARGISADRVGADGLSSRRFQTPAAQARLPAPPRRTLGPRVAAEIAIALASYSAAKKLGLVASTSLKGAL